MYRITFGRINIQFVVITFREWDEERFYFPSIALNCETQGSVYGAFLDTKLSDPPPHLPTHFLPCPISCL